MDNLHNSIAFDNLYPHRIGQFPPHCFSCGYFFVLLFLWQHLLSVSTTYSLRTCIFSNIKSFVSSFCFLYWRHFCNTRPESRIWCCYGECALSISFRRNRTRTYWRMHISLCTSPAFHQPFYLTVDFWTGESPLPAPTPLCLR